MKNVNSSLLNAGRVGASVVAGPGIDLISPVVVEYPRVNELEEPAPLEILLVGGAGALV